MAKRILAMILMLVLAMPFFAVSEGNEALFNEIWNYTMFIDRLLEDEISAIMYFDKFYESRAHEDLLIAKAAIHAAYKDALSLEAPQFSMTEEECLHYMDAGVEIEALLLSVEEAETARTSTLLFFENLIDTIETEIYFQPALENLKEQLTYYARDTVYEARNIAYMVNYLLLQLGGGDKTDAFWQSLKENTTVVKKHMDTFTTDIEALITMSGENIDQIEQNIDKINVLIEGFGDYMLNITLEASESGDMTIFKKNRTEIIGEPVVFPMPQFILPSDAEYTYIFSEPGTEELYVISAGSEITSAPDRIKITAKGITLDDIQEYLDYLTILEYNPAYEFALEDGVDTLYLMAEKGDGTLMIIWNESETIVYLMPPAVSLVPYIYWK